MYYVLIFIWIIWCINSNRYVLSSAAQNDNDDATGARVVPSRNFNGGSRYSSAGEVERSESNIRNDITGKMSELQEESEEWIEPPLIAYRTKEDADDGDIVIPLRPTSKPAKGSESNLPISEPHKFGRKNQYHTSGQSYLRVRNINGGDSTTGIGATVDVKTTGNKNIKQHMHRHRPSTAATVGMGGTRGRANAAATATATGNFTSSGSEGTSTGVAGRGPVKVKVVNNRQVKVRDRSQQRSGHH
mmetsp:Transcript_28227/g.47467  ORF Transcript_28227/g.47467 Transcript_28227/m.47467 type:complete len:245 (-) Transcript_28227:20-754(-)